MKKPKSIELRIPEPCNEGWDTMTPSEKGRFCDSCEKEVVAFDKMTDKQIVAFFKQKPSKVCGHFRADQLKRYPVQSTKPKASRFPAMFIGSILAVLTANATSAFGQTKIGEAQMETEMMLGDVISVPEPAPSDSSKMVTGKIIDSYTGNGAPHIIVMIKESRIASSTDMQGNYSLQIPTEYRNKAITLVFQAHGYDSQERVVIPDQLPIALDLTIKSNQFPQYEDQMIEGEVEMIMGKVLPPERMD